MFYNPVKGVKWVKDEPEWGSSGWKPDRIGPPPLSPHLVRISKTIPGHGPHPAGFIANKDLYTDPTSDLLEPALEV